MSARIATHSVRDLRDALDAAEHDLANGEPGARFAVNYNRRELESMAYNIAADLIDARDELTTAQSHLTHALDDAATQRTRAEAAEAEVARLRTALADAEVTVAAARVHHSFDAADRERAIAERDAARAEAAGLRAVVADLTERMEDAHDGGEVVALQAAEHRAAADALRDERDAARRAATLAETERDTLRALTDSMRADNVRLRAIYDAVDELVFRDYAAEVESYSETAPGSHAAAQVRAGDAYDALMRLRDAERERRAATGEGQ